MTDITKKQKTLFEQAAEGRSIVIELFEGYEIRFLDDGVRWTLMPDVRKSLGISKQTASKVINRIELISPGCSRVATMGTLGETDPFKAAQKVILVNPTGLSLFLQQIDTERLGDPEVKAKCNRMQLWMAELSGEVLSGETEKATASLLEHAYDKVDIRVNPIGDVLEQHLKVAKLFSEARNADYSVMVAVAITETEKDTGRSLQEYQKLLPPVEVNEIGYLTPTRLAEVCGYRSNQQINKLLEMMGYQEKRGKDWFAIGEGISHSKMYPYNNKGHTGFQIKWKESVVPHIEKFERSHNLY